MLTSQNADGDVQTRKIEHLRYGSKCFFLKWTHDRRFGTEEQLGRKNTYHCVSRDERHTWLHGGHPAAREGPSRRAGAGHHVSPQAARRSCHSSPTHRPSPQDASLATKGGPSPLPCGPGHWEGLPLALVSLAELTPDGHVLSLPAAEAGPGSQHAGQGAPAPSQRVAAAAELPCPRPLVSQRWPAGLWEQGVQQASLPRLRGAVPLLACPLLRLRGTDLGSAGSGNRRWGDTAPQDRAEPQPSGPGRHTPSPLLSRGSLRGSWALGPTHGVGAAVRTPAVQEQGRFPREHGPPSA